MSQSNISSYINGAMHANSCIELPFLCFINSRDIPIFVRSGSVSPIRTNSIRRKYSRSNSQPTPTEDIELNYRRRSSHHSLRRNSGLRKISSQEQVNQLTRFLLLNEEPSMFNKSTPASGTVLRLLNHILSIASQSELAVVY